MTKKKRLQKIFARSSKIAVAGPVTSFVVAAKLGCIWWVVFPHANTATVANIVESTMAILVMAEGILFLWYYSKCNSWSI